MVSVELPLKIACAPNSFTINGCVGDNIKKSYT